LILFERLILHASSNCFHIFSRTLHLTKTHTDTHTHADRQTDRQSDADKMIILLSFSCTQLLWLSAYSFSTHSRAHTVGQRARQWSAYHRKISP